MAKLDSCLFEGHVMHHRFRPSVHRFIYRVFSLNVNLSELENLDRLKLFSVNRFNLFSFHEKDHGSGKGHLLSEIKQRLCDRGYPEATHKIQLLCYPRILGYTFNPLSVYFCYDLQDNLKVILYEVSNTFGSRHTYLLQTSGKEKLVRHGCDKTMYVSPFMPMDTRYQFRINPPKSKVAVCIRQTELSDNDRKRQPILHATFTGDRTELNDRTLFKAFLRYPLMTLKVMTAIHWEAFRLWRKKLKIQPRQKGIQQSISWKDEHGVSHYESL